MHQQQTAYPANPAPMRYNPYAYNPLSRGAKIAIGIAVVVGVGAATYMLWPRSASAALPPVGPAPTTGGGGGGGTSQAGKINAPPFPYQAANTQSVELTTATSVHANWLNAVSQAMQQSGNTGSTPSAANIQAARSSFGIPASRTIPGYLTDKAYQDMYPAARNIPKEQNRGSGWQPYIESWHRLHEWFKQAPWTS